MIHAASQQYIRVRAPEMPRVHKPTFVFFRLRRNGKALPNVKNVRYTAGNYKKEHITNISIVKILGACENYVIVGGQNRPQELDCRG